MFTKRNDSDVKTFAQQESVHLEAGFFEWNVPEDKITICSRLLEKLLFTTNNTVQNYSSWIKLIHPEDLNFYESHVREVVTKENPYISLVCRQMGRDRKWHRFNIWGKVTEFDSQETPIHCVGVCSEIIEHKESLTNSSQTQLLISEINHIKNSQKNNDSLEPICTEVLKSFNKLTNSSSSTLLFSTLEELTTDINNQLPSFSYDQNATSVEWSSEKNDFIRNFPITRSNLIQNNEQTSLLGIHLNLPFNQHAMVIIERREAFNEEIVEFLNPLINTINDILTLKKLEEKRKELDSIIDFFIKQVPAPVAMFDSEMRHKFVSDAWKRDNKLGETHEFLNKSYYEVYPEEPAVWKENYQRALAGEVITWGPTENVDKFGQTYWTEGVIAPWYAFSGSPSGMIMYYNDITSKIEQENILKNTLNRLNETNQALEKSNEYLESFAYVCSHDLKEPLRKVANYIQLLVNKHVDDFDDVSVRYVHFALEGVNRMNTLIQDILSYSKVIKQLCPEKAVINLNNVGQDVKKDFSYRLREVGGQLNVSHLPTIKAEAAQVYQLFSNLVSNAIKFKSEKPLVIEIFATKNDLYWEIYIRDNGIGINKEYHKSIFEAFKRLNSRHYYEGSGLGLSICQKIVEALEGTIEVQSNSTGGCDFIVRIPR